MRATTTRTSRECTEGSGAVDPWHFAAVRATSLRARGIHGGGRVPRRVSAALRRVLMALTAGAQLRTRRLRSPRRAHNCHSGSAAPQRAHADPQRAHSAPTARVCDSAPRACGSHGVRAGIFPRARPRTWRAGKVGLQLTWATAADCALWEIPPRPNAQALSSTRLTSQAVGGGIEPPPTAAAAHGCIPFGGYCFPWLRPMVAAGSVDDIPSGGCHRPWLRSGWFSDVGNFT